MVRDPTQPIALAERLTAELHSVSTIVQQLASEIRENAVSLAATTADIRNLREAVALLSRIIKDGNGDSLLTRMSLAESSMERLEEDLKGLSKAIDELEARGHEVSAEEKKLATERHGQGLHFWATVVTSLAALAGSVLALLLK